MEKLIAQVSTAKNHQLGLSGQHAQLLTQQQQIKVRQEQLIQQIKKQETELTTITTSLAAADTDRLIQLQEGQKALQNELTVLYQQLPHTQAALHEITFDTLAVAKQRLTTTLQEGKRVQQQIETVQQQLTIHQQKKERIQHQVGQLTAHRQQLQTKVAEENDFHCDLIDGACPYIEVITKKAAHTLTEQ
ncbi:MAG: hypothetical protein Q8O99_00335 [bacterium]|nr:hypothetical protein [bacterium]